MKIETRGIGPSHAPFIIAEMSANHHGTLNNALQIIDSAKQAGADAVKLQTYTADTITLDCRHPVFRVGKGSLWEGRSLFDLYSEPCTPWDWQPDLKMEAESMGLHCFPSPFDDTAVDFPEGMNVPAHKIASFELVDTELLKKVAATGKPVIMSRGMATFEEIGEAVQMLRANGCSQLALLKCTSAYPSLPEDMNLRTIPHMAKSFGLPVGFSDHTLGTVVPVSAVSLGACIIEKHLTLRRSDGGPDSAFSLEPAEMRELVEKSERAWQSLGKVFVGPTEAERPSIAFRRSLYIVKDLKAGDMLTKENVRAIRPGYGLPVKELDRILGRKATRDLERGTPLAENDIA